jgi:hypothetical protein
MTCSIRRIPMANVRIVPTADGPNMIDGSVEVAWPSGHVIPTEGKADDSGAIYLCPCGHSNYTARAEQYEI